MQCLVMLKFSGASHFGLAQLIWCVGRQVIEDAQIVEKRLEKDTAGNPQSVQDLYETTAATVIGFFVHNTANNLFKGDLGPAYKQYVALVKYYFACFPFGQSRACKLMKANPVSGKRASS
jgi:hypothetical protein